VRLIRVKLVLVNLNPINDTYQEIQFWYRSEFRCLRWVGYCSNERGFSVESSLQPIDFFVVETKPFVGSTVHVILARQTCGQRSSKTAESKHLSAGKLFFRASLQYVLNIKM